MNEAAYRKVVARIERKTRDAGYENTLDFHRRSGLSRKGEKDIVAYYTVVRAFDRKEKPVAIPTIIQLAQFAGCGPDEIRDMLTEIGDTHWCLLIGEQHGEKLSAQEQALLGAARAITGKDERYWKRIRSTLELIAEAADLDVSAYLDRMGR